LLISAQELLKQETMISSLIKENGSVKFR